MLDSNKNPVLLNNFLVYNQTILNKSENTIKEYNYDLNKFFKFIKIHKNLTQELDFGKIDITDIDLNLIKQIDINDLYAFIGYLTNECKNAPPSRARKIASLRSFFNYLTKRTNLLEKNPAQNLESPKLGKRMPKYLTLEESKTLLNATEDEENRNKERDYAIITLFLNCGMRLSELVNINFTDIVMEERKTYCYW